MRGSFYFGHFFRCLLDEFLNFLITERATFTPVFDTISEIITQIKI